MSRQRCVKRCVNRCVDRPVDQVPADDVDHVETNVSELDRGRIGDPRQSTVDRPVEVDVADRAAGVLGSIRVEREVGAGPEPSTGERGRFVERLVLQATERIDRHERGQRPVGRDEGSGAGDVGDQDAAVDAGGSCRGGHAGSPTVTGAGDSDLLRPCAGRAAERVRTRRAAAGEVGVAVPVANSHT